MQDLRLAIETRDETGAIAHMAGLVPEYQPGETWASVRKPPVASIPAAVG
jgi:hypothetical protein